MLTQLELAELSGVHNKLISQLETGHHLAAPGTIKKLAEALQISPQKLAGICELTPVARRWRPAPRVQKGETASPSEAA